ncbi:MAG: nucleotidyltransferase family protein [Deltaproteobacteria bacterium]|nr:nucleotidyltransferase family protein [Deltaproteobacteria bacterium]
MNPSRTIKGLLKKAATEQEKILKQLYVAAAISSAFEKKGIQAVLVGGAVVEYYTAGGHTTVDIDMILPPLEKQEIETVMKGLGFERFEDYRHWIHPQIRIPIEFPPGPLQIGHLLVQEVNEIEIEKIKLKILRMEDILLDRLVAAQEWKDPQARIQAEMLMYTHYTDIDWPYVHQKSSQLGILQLFQKIQKKVKRRVKGVFKTN